MGFFKDMLDDVSNKMQQVRLEQERAVEQASRMETNELCRRLQAASGPMKNGYCIVLKERIRGMEGSDLKALFIASHRYKCTTALRVIAPELERRGYLENVDGKWEKTCTW